MYTEAEAGRSSDACTNHHCIRLVRQVLAWAASCVIRSDSAVSDKCRSIHGLDIYLICGRKQLSAVCTHSVLSCFRNPRRRTSCAQSNTNLYIAITVTILCKGKINQCLLPFTRHSVKKLLMGGCDRGRFDIARGRKQKCM